MLDYEDILAKDEETAAKRLQEVIEEYCMISALVYKTKDDYRYANDGFCYRCPNIANGCYRNDGKVIEYIRKAVLKQLKADGYKIAKGFDARSGKEKK